MSIKKLEDGRYEVDIRPTGRNGKRIRRKFNKKHEAIAFERYNIMSSYDKEKLKLIRESERLNVKQAADLVGINYVTYHGYESGKAKMSIESAMKFFKHPRFRKYRDWFMFDETDPDAGQIAPALAHSGLETTISSRLEKKTG